MSEQTTPNNNDNDGPRQLRRLLPAPMTGQTGRTGGTGRTPAPVLRRRSQPVTAACKACRQHKVKCSGERPHCRRCALRALPCIYSTEPGETPSQALRDRATILEEIFSYLKTLPERDAQSILQKIRSGNDTTTILNHIKAGDALLQMAVSPETRFRYEFPYKTEMPEDNVSGNPYLYSLIYEATSLYPSHQNLRSPEPTVADQPGSSRSEESLTLYLKPFHAATVVDSRLIDAKISLWTNVCNDDVLMRELLGNFFRCEYNFTAAFQKDLFLEDMAAQRGDFCSSLLVNIMLGYACVCYPKFADRAQYWNPHTLLYSFIAEAKRLWELEATEPRITTIQAGILFSVFHNLCGLDEIGQSYRIQGIALAHKLRLFDDSINGQTSRFRRGREFAAWALYNWETLTAFSFMLCPLLKEPPTYILPDPLKAEQWYGEVWLQYPASHRLYRSSFGQVFKARSEFRIIMNEFCQEAYGEGSKAPPDLAQNLLARLQSWLDGLADPLLPKTIVLPAHMQLHIYYYHLIRTIHEQLLGPGTVQEQAASPKGSNTQRYLQTLVRLYYLRHGFDSMNLFIVIPLMLAATDCVDAIHEQEPGPELETLRSTLFLAVKGLYTQRRNHYLAEALFRVIRGRMRPAEVALLREKTDIAEDDADKKRQMAQVVRSHWPVSVVKNKKDMDTFILTNLVESYAHLNTGTEDQEASKGGDKREEKEEERRTIASNA